MNVAIQSRATLATLWISVRTLVWSYEPLLSTLDYVFCKADMFAVPESRVGVDTR